MTCGRVGFERGDLYEVVCIAVETAKGIVAGNDRTKSAVLVNDMDHLGWYFFVVGLASLDGWAVFGVGSALLLYVGPW